MKQPNGFTLWESDSLVCLITGITRKSQNVKTMQMLQTWILSKAQNPVAARLSGHDATNCGDCPHRAGSCYVNLGQAPLAIWKAYNAGKYPTLTDWSILKGKAIRFGAYGDPSFVPMLIWQRLNSVAASHTGYTHQWRKPHAQGYRHFLMASCDSASDQLDAEKLGWRTFRVIRKGYAKFNNEIVCPSESRGILCINCKLCSGAGMAKNIVVTLHGSGSNKFQG